MAALGSFEIIIGGTYGCAAPCGAKGTSSGAVGATGAAAAGGTGTGARMGFPLENIIDGSSILG